MHAYMRIDGIYDRTTYTVYSTPAEERLTLLSTPLFLLIIVQVLPNAALAAASCSSTCTRVRVCVLVGLLVAAVDAYKMAETSHRKKAKEIKCTDLLHARSTL